MRSSSFIEHYHYLWNWSKWWLRMIETEEKLFLCMILERKIKPFKMIMHHASIYYIIFTDSVAVHIPSPLISWARSGNSADWADFASANSSISFLFPLILASPSGVFPHLQRPREMYECRWSILRINYKSPTSYL